MIDKIRNKNQYEQVCQLIEEFIKKATNGGGFNSLNKKETDEDYDAALNYCIQNIADMSICAGTHNENSSMHLVNLMAQFGIAANDRRIYFSQLLGMSDNLSYNLSEAGYNVAKYVPYGPVKKVLPYLFRRAEENTAIAGQMGRELSLIVAEQRRRKG